MNSTKTTDACDTQQRSGDACAQNEDKHAWTNDEDEVRAFARFLVESSYFHGNRDGQRALLYFLGSPWKWSSEHARWIAAGRPDEVRDVDSFFAVAEASS